MKSNVIEYNQEQAQQIDSTASANSMILNPVVMQQIDMVAEMMASGKTTVPQHLRGSKADCFAIVLQAAQWGMNPFSVAQKTHLVNGTLGYEAQLVNAVVSSSNAIKGRFKYEYDGDWKNTNKGSTACIRAGAVLNGESQITWGEWLFIGDVTTKNSPVWKTAPKQQAAYLAVKYWARLFCPEVILGVYSHDEMEPPVEKEINPRPEPLPTEMVEKVTLESALEKIDEAKSIKELNDKKLVDYMNKLNQDDIVIARKKYMSRKKQIKDSDNKQVQENPTDWKSRIEACQSKDELTALLRDIPEEELLSLESVIDTKEDSFR